MDSKDSTKIPAVPGVSAGATTTSSVAKPEPPGEAPRLPRADGAKASVVPYGGNAGGRPRADGLVPGSPEAIQADRDKEAERGRKRRAAGRIVQQNTVVPPALPSAAATPSPSSAPGVPVAGSPSVAVDAWSAADFNFVVADCIQIAETWRVKTKTDKAIKGNLAPVVAEEIGAAFAFPSQAKDSLRASSPEGFAKVFNALRVPISLKPAISACPALAYIIVRDFQLDAKLDKMIAAVAEREAASKATPQPEKKS